MKVLTYMCENCYEPHIFNSLNNNNEFLCPKCGEKMLYFGTEEIDPNTKKVINRYDEEERRQKNPGKPKSIVECPYCHSISIKRISSITRALFTDASAVGKQFQCNRCSAYF